MTAILSPFGAGSVTLWHNVTQPPFGADPAGVKDSAAAIRAAITAASGAGGVVYFPAGTYLVGTSLSIPSGVYYRGDGQAASVIKATSGLAGPIFTQVIASGHSIINVGWRDLTLDGNTGPTGSNIGIAIDTTALNSTPYYNVKAEDVDFQNFLIGWQHAANNFNGGALNNETLCLTCRFYNCGTGAAFGGTYASTFSECLFAGCTVNAVGTSGYNGTPVLSGVSGPTTNATVRGCHIEGLGNLTGGGSATESGISLNSTLPAVTDCQFYNISRFPVQVEDNEGLGGVISGIRVWGSGGTVIGVEQLNNGGGFVTISDVSCSEVSQNTSLTAAFGQQGVIAIDSGNATISNIAVAPATPGFGNPPAYALNLGADGSGKMGIVDVSQFHCSSPGTSWLLVNNTQNSMVLKIRNSTGFNPVGVVVVAVPATTVATATATYDRTFYVTGAAGGSCTVTATGGPAVTVPASGTMAVFCPAGATITPVYGAGNAPTWVVEGN